MKNYLNILLAVLIVIMLFSTGYSINKVIEQREEIERQTENLKQLDSNFQELYLTNSELNTKVIQSDKRIRKTDSILLSRDLKIKQLENLHVVTVTITNKDTVYLTNTDTLIIRQKKDSNLYKTHFTDDRNCIRIEGFIISTDEFPSVAITSQNAEIETYEIQVKRRWYQFWKPKTWTERYTKCGDLRVLDVKKIK